MALRMSASYGLTRRSRSVSVLDGAISSGTTSPVDGGRYWLTLWCVSSRSSSLRMPVRRRTSIVAKARTLPLLHSFAAARWTSLQPR